VVAITSVGFNCKKINPKNSRIPSKERIKVIKAIIPAIIYMLFQSLIR